MGHVEALAERILFLNGDVQMAVTAPVETITDPASNVGQGEMKQGSARDYNCAAQTCGANADAVSKRLFERLVADEEGHQNEFEVPGGVREGDAVASQDRRLRLRECDFEDVPSSSRRSGS